jgi:membrane protein DedA with SNARE-associated domain
VLEVPQLIESFSYIAILLLLISAGMGAPVSEELILLTSGVLAARGTLDLRMVVPVCYLGVLTGDTVLYGVGSRLGRRVLEHKWFGRLLKSRFTTWIERHYQRHGILTVMLARQVAGMRAPAFVIAGIARLPYRRFIAADAAAGLLSVPLMLCLGHRFGAQLPRVLEALGQARALLLAGIGLLVIAALVWRLRARRSAVATSEQREG